jgi:hypothetical protein
MALSRRALQRFGGVVLIGAAAWLGLLASIYLYGRYDGAAPADVIVVLGAAQYDGRPSPVLRARLDHAIELYHRGVAPAIITTGGVGVRDTGDTPFVMAFLRKRSSPSGPARERSPRWKPLLSSCGVAECSRLCSSVTRSTLFGSEFSPTALRSEPAPRLPARAPSAKIPPLNGGTSSGKVESSS